MAEDDFEIEINLEEIHTSPPPASPGKSGPAADALPQRFARLVNDIKHDRLRNLVTNIYVGQHRALDTLKDIERILTEKDMSDVGRLFDVLRNQCANLLAYLTGAIKSADFLDEDLKDTLDGMRFVIAHEMNRVFQIDFPALAGEAGAPQSRAGLTRSWGLMNNCLQQTTIALAQAFDPAICGEQLFEDYQSKVENSLTLYRDLNALLQKVNRAHKAKGILLKHSLIKHLELFRDETMRFLMYKDWAEFENFVEKIKGAFEEIESFDNVLYEFAPYLDTLIHHVGMREVLRNIGAAAHRNVECCPRPSSPRVLVGRFDEWNLIGHLNFYHITVP